jgi:uncharacterized protein YaiE (UPF0345 family)
MCNPAHLMPERYPPIIYQAGDSYTVTGNSTFTAQWSELYTITFSEGEGSGTPPEYLEATWGKVITLPGQGSMTAPDRSDFSGWKTQDNYGIYQAGDSYTVTGNSTLTAQWEAWIPQGVYIGVISFVGGVTAITPAQQGGRNDSTLYYLDQSGKSDFTSRLNSHYERASESGTALYYAVHKALANLTKAGPMFSKDAIQSINLITFIDGLDNGSFGASNANPIDGKKAFPVPSMRRT